MKINDGQGNEMSKEQVLELTINNLSRLQVPVMDEQLGKVIRAAVGDLTIVLQVMTAEKAEAEAAAEKAAGADGAPELEVLPGGPEDNENPGNDTGSET